MTPCLYYSIRWIAISDCDNSVSIDIIIEIRLDPFEEARDFFIHFVLSCYSSA